MRTCFSQITDAGCRWRSFDGWGGWSTYQGAVFPQRAASRGQRGNLVQHDTGRFQKSFSSCWRSVGTSFATSTRAVPAAKRFCGATRGPLETALLLISLVPALVLCRLSTLRRPFHISRLTPSILCSGLAGAFRCDCGIGHVSPDASCARPELVDQSRRTGGIISS